MDETKLMRRAVIDLGTNTFNLLIADVQGRELTLVHHDKVAVMLGMGGINQGYIAQDALQRARETLQTFVERSRNLGVEHIAAIGTSALRDASNSGELLSFASEELEVQIQIISGMDEARLIYEGVRLSHDFSQPAVIMDIGGGSTEFILANGVGPQWSESFDVGVSRIYQFLDEPDEFGEYEFRSIEEYLETRFDQVLPKFDVPHLVGSSGTFETLFEMLFEAPFPDVDVALELPLERLKEILHWSKSASLQARIENPWIVPMRKKMLPIAAVKILWVLNYWPIEKVWVSPFSLKEGALVKLD